MPVPELERIWSLLSRKLTGEASAAEIAEFQALLEQNPALAPICRDAEAYWQKNPIHDEEFLEATWLVHLMRLEQRGHHIEQRYADSHEHQEQPAAPAKKSRRLLGYLMTTVILITIALFYFYGGKNRPSAEPPVASIKTDVPEIEVSTKNGDHSRIQLPDGSQVWLNAGSKLHYDKSFGGNRREVHLVGEAYFDVVKNPAKPFIINTATMQLRVLGTQFNVRCYANESTSEASLVHGSLEVYEKKRGQKWLLKPNEKLVVYNNLSVVKPGEVKAPQTETWENMPIVTLKTLTYNEKDSVAVETAWTKSRLSFKDESFESVARKMERWYDAEFVFRDEKKKALMMQGTFTTETLEQALAALEFSFNFHYKIEKRKVFIY